jgi:hypothetical protein
MFLKLRRPPLLSFAVFHFWYLLCKVMGKEKVTLELKKQKAYTGGLLVWMGWLIW